MKHSIGNEGSSNNHKSKKKETLQTVEIKVTIDCDGCKHKIKKAISSMKGIMSIEINRKQQKVTVTGYIDAEKVLKKVKSTGKKAEISSCVLKSLVVQLAKDEASTSTSTLMNQEVRRKNDNPNSCSIL